MVHLRVMIGDLRLRLLILLLAVLLAASLPSASHQEPPLDAPPPFDEWRQELMAEARARGYSETLVQQALGGVEPLPQVIRNDRSQAELVVGFDRYYQFPRDAADRPPGPRAGAPAPRSRRRASKTPTNVQRRVIVAIWGIETRYGRVTGNTPVFQALATLAWEPRRSATFFRGELFDALTMVSRGYIDTASMTGSWAGAMGHPQFMPSSYLKFAEDFDRDGRRDIWRSTPDALASIANYLKEWGWNDEFRWGLRGARHSGRARAHRARDVDADGGLLGDAFHDRAHAAHRMAAAGRTAGRTARRCRKAMFPAGLVDTDTRSFLVYPNYDAILRYNCAHYYALTVALLVGPDSVERVEFDLIGCLTSEAG